MAKKRRGRKAGVNKSQIIRDYMGQHPKEGPSAVAAALNKREGWKITPAYVSTIKSNAKKKTPGKRGRKPGRRAAGSISEASLLQAKKLAEQLGGVTEAKAALDLLAKLMD